ncbi:MAG TPA: adenosylcobinamide-GDP ribazoletransferase [Stellaceae bacterium]|jgi:adenosylcobinamide-GDP ribazoletransferase|nr:adenosylcobinamide-GDP ribazoletransferase [Stellaceae bacterium]
MIARDTLHAAVGDLRDATALLTRLPVYRLMPYIAATDRRRFAWAFPVVGAGVGAMAAFGHWLFIVAGMPPVLAALWTIVVLLLATGALHEDGLADVADALGARGDTAHRLAIMRDSRIGAFGGLSLILSLSIRAGAIAQLPATHIGAALVIAGAASRGLMLGIMWWLPAARAEGLGASVAVPYTSAAIAGIVIAALPAAATLPLHDAACLIVILGVAGAVIARHARRSFGGQTGDILGAAQQVGECLTMTFLATALH